MTANNLGTISALIPSTAHFSSSALRAVRYGREQTEKREARPKEHVPQLLCRIRACTPQAITLAEASHLLAGLLTQFQHLLTHTTGKCDGSNRKTNTDGPFGSVQCP